MSAHTAGALPLADAIFVVAAAATPSIAAESASDASSQCFLKKSGLRCYCVFGCLL